MILSDLSFPLRSRTVFDKTVARDWYDGITSGVAMSSQLSASFKFDIVAWGPLQEKRVFAFSPLAIQDFERIVTLLSGHEPPSWPIWFPAWPSWSSRDSELTREMKHLLSSAKAPEYVVAADSVFEMLFAARQLDAPAQNSLPSDFDGVPFRDNFDDWKKFLRLSD